MYIYLIYTRVQISVGLITIPTVESWLNLPRLTEVLDLPPSPSHARARQKVWKYCVVNMGLDCGVYYCNCLLD